MTTGALSRKKCIGCGTINETFTIRPAAYDAHTVELTPCMNCDRIRCPQQHCGVRVTNGKAKHCPNGHRL
jgi:hypothetical protein